MEPYILWVTINGSWYPIERSEPRKLGPGEWAIDQGDFCTSGMRVGDGQGDYSRGGLCGFEIWIARPIDEREQASVKQLTMTDVH